jgi:hypothetical protein
MAITKQSNTPATRGFAVNASSADLSGTEELQAAPAAGTNIYLTQLEISCVEAITVTIGAGETGGAVTTVLFGPFNFAAGNGSPISIQLNPAVKLAAATSLTADASGAGVVQIFVQGYIE